MIAIINPHSSTETLDVLKLGNPEEFDRNFTTSTETLDVLKHIFHHHQKWTQSSSTETLDVLKLPRWRAIFETFQPSTETLDVLKHVGAGLAGSIGENFNRNIGCIETRTLARHYTKN